MENLNDLVSQLIEDIEVTEDIPVAYEVWAIGFNEVNEPTCDSMLLTTFDDPDQAVEYAKTVTLADVVNIAAEEDYEDLTYECHSISIEVETVVPSDDEEELNMNVGTIYKKRIELFEEAPDFVCLSNDKYEVIEETGNIAVPSQLLNNYSKGDIITVLFEDEEQPWPIEYRIIHKNDTYCICEFV